jgi:predicted Zn-dependent peptidase
MRKYYENIDESSFCLKTSSGLPVYIVSKEKSKNFHMAILVNFGNVDQRFINIKNKKYYKVPSGTAHFLEHKMFESKDEKIFEKFSRQNASINAYTNATSTVYYFSCTDNIEKNISLFLKILQNPYITHENVEKEKGIIGQEIKMYRDNPSWRVHNNFLKSLYKSNYVKYDIAGTEEDINRITLNNLLDCYKNFYTSNNMAIVIIGNVNEKAIFNQIDKEWKVKSKLGEVKRIYPHEPHHVAQKQIIEELEIAENNFIMGFKGLCTGLTGINLVKREMILNIILEYLVGDISPLYEKLYDKNYIDSNFSYGVNAHKQFIFSMIGGVSKSPEYVKEELIKEIMRILNEGINEKSFHNIKKMMIGNSIKIFDNESGLLNNIISYQNKGASFFDIIDIINSINTQDVFNSVTELFNPDNFAMSIAIPAKKEKK